jgi:hypothetical protein
MPNRECLWLEIIKYIELRICIDDLSKRLFLNHGVLLVERQSFRSKINQSETSRRKHVLGAWKRREFVPQRRRLDCAKSSTIQITILLD